MGHAAAAPCRLRACGCTTASGTPMPIRVPWPWMGATPHLGMPRSASGRMAMCIPIVPSAAGSLPASSPCRKAIERRFEKTDYCARECQGPSSPLVPASVVVGPFSRAVPGNGAAGAARCSSARRTSGRRADESPPSKRRPTAFPQGSMVGSDPPAEGGMGVHMPILRDADRGIPNRGVAPSLPRAPRGWAAARAASP